MRELTYKIEEEYLSKHAARSSQTRGRLKDEPPCPMRTDYQRDRDRILHSKSFRRLKNKTQVFLSPEGDHYRTRLTHTLDVAQIARSIARALKLNEDLAEAIALGHDLGHTPFGHAGEKTLQRLTGGVFEHSRQSLRVVDILENDGSGLNLTYEVRDGILNHQMGSKPETLEGMVVCYADKIAYINHDIDDAIRAGILKTGDLPQKCVKVLGTTNCERINTMITAIYNKSDGQDFVDMESEVKECTLQLREFLFKNVYTDNEAKNEEAKADRMIEILFNFLKNNTAAMPGFYVSLIDKYGLEQAVCDYISSMSDKFAVYKFEQYFVPASWKIK